MAGVLDLRTQLVLSFHRALLGAVTDNLYAVSAEIREGVIYVVGYYLGDPKKDDEWEELSVACTEVISDFYPELNIHERYVDVKDEPLPASLRGDLMFLRHVCGMWPNFDN